MVTFNLVIEDDEGHATVVPVIRDSITIGRAAGSAIRLTEWNVSRKHAKISRVDGVLAIEDLGSYNGVKVNGGRIAKRTVLAIGDRVQIGDYTIDLADAATEAQPRTTAKLATPPAPLGASTPAALFTSAGP